MKSINGLTTAQIKAVGKTSNRKLPITPLVYQYISNNIKRFSSDGFRKTLLDYGCGKNPAHLAVLKKKFSFIFRYDVMHFPLRPMNYYNVVAVSNVLNVLPEIENVTHTILDIASFVEPRRGCAIINYPSDPRKPKMQDGSIANAEIIELLLKMAFRNVTRIKGYGTKQSPVFYATHY